MGLGFCPVEGAPFLLASLVTGMGELSGAVGSSFYHMSAPLSGSLLFFLGSSIKVFIITMLEKTLNEGIYDVVHAVSRACFSFPSLNPQKTQAERYHC